jgi:hypothetical protein
MDEQVRMAKEMKQATGTHFLESTDGQISQKGKRETWQVAGTDFLESPDGGSIWNDKRNMVRHRHSLSRAYRWRGNSEWQKRQSKQHVLTNWGAQTEDQVRMAKETKQATALTLWTAQMEKQVTTTKETEQATGTHILESADRGTSQNGK